MNDYLATRITELGEEPTLLDLLSASIEGNIETIFHAIRHGIASDNLEPPVAAYEYARRLAQRGISVNALVRAYRLGQQRLLQAAYDYIAEDAELSVDLVPAVFQRLVDEVSEYIDWMSEKVALLYQQERDAWLANRTTARESQVRGIIEGGHIDATAAAATLGYNLAARHVAVIAWTHHSAPDTVDGLGRFTSAINAAAAAMGSPRSSLIISRDQDTAWGWISVPEGWEYEESLGDRLNATEFVHLALGSAHTGAAGFRLSHHEVMRVQNVCLAGRTPAALSSHDEPGMALVSLLANDVEGARSWVRSVLGPLAEDSEANARHRSTLLTFLRHDRSYTATAAAMTMHKNSIRYRVEMAEAMLGMELSSNRLNIEAALYAHSFIFVPGEQTPD
ncbi:helix-turn-helix domain-containing protein [Brevibacterium antiquum]